MMRLALCLVWLAGCGHSPALSAPEKPGASSTAIDPSRLRPAMLYWLIGTNRPEGPGRTVETIYVASHEGRAVWRALHRDDDPIASACSYHLDEVDRETLRPVRSVFHADEQTSLIETFAHGAVRIERVREGKASSWERALERTVMPPPGPGYQLLIGALPLRDGYTTTFLNFTPTWELLGSESGQAQGGVRPVKVSVVGRETIRTRAGEFDTWVVMIQPADGGAGPVTKKWVLAAPPHYGVRTEFTPTPGEMMASEVTAIALARSVNLVVHPARVTHGRQRGAPAEIRTLAPRASPNVTVVPGGTLLSAQCDRQAPPSQH